MNIGIGNLVGLFGLLALLPFIILYFIRPKPKEVVIPSLIFLNKSREFKSKSGFFRRMIKDWLLLLQILILGLIALFFAAPYITVSNVSSGTVVLVLDTSASISGNKFDNLKESALNNIGDKNTIILVGSKPNILLEEGDENQARKEIKGLTEKDTGSAITESLKAAREIAEDVSGDKAIVVISDFLETEGENIDGEIKTIKDMGIPVNLININTKNKDNAGFISLILGKTNGVAVVKNFCCGNKEVSINYDGKNEVITLNEGETYSYKFDTVFGSSTIKLLLDDEIRGDNNVHISNQQDENAKVLLITGGENKYLQAALEASSEIDLSVKNPSSAKKGNYDVYILSEIKSINSKLSEMLSEELNSGKSIIVFAEDGISGNYAGLLNFDIGSEVRGGDSSITTDASFTQGLDFGRQDTVRQIKCQGKCDGVYVTSGDQPLIMVQPSGSGLIGYYGIPNENEGFQNRPDYPLFWTRFVKHLGGVRSIGTMNLLTGSTISFGDEVSFEKPSGRNMKSNIILFDEAGFYKIEGRIYSANLLNERESSLEESATSGEGENISVINKDELVKKSIWEWLIITAMILVIIEWIVGNKKLRSETYHV
ncbi:MAG: BatA domain-containing protein [Nanoarchaeota archaeon]|nr:BatA domain-containing protein [Nanoarchaeota archaeon]